MRIILLGPPGAGKGTQAQLIAKKFSIPSISTGDMLRAAIREKSALGLKVQAIIEAGNLVSDEIMIDLIKDRIAEPDCENGFLLDGFPRTIPQAQALKKAQITIDAVVEIVVDDEMIIRRLTGRRVHPQSGRTYHVDFQSPKKSGFDDETGEPLIQRDDDKEETVKNRLNVYHQLTSPLVKHYQQQEVKYIQADGEGSIDAVNKAIIEGLIED